MRSRAITRTEPASRVWVESLPMCAWDTPSQYIVQVSQSHGRSQRVHLRLLAGDRLCDLERDDDRPDAVPLQSGGQVEGGVQRPCRRGTGRARSFCVEIRESEER